MSEAENPVQVVNNPEDEERKEVRKQVINNEDKQIKVARNYRENVS